MGFLNLKYSLENVGNIDNAVITIKRLTVIAGENSTGKTFVTKSLYTILNSIYKNHYAEQLIIKYKELHESYNDLIDSLAGLTSKDKDFDDKFSQQSDDIKKLISFLSQCSFEEQEDAELMVQKSFEEYLNFIESHFISRLKLKKFQKYKEEINELLEIAHDLVALASNRREVIVKQINSHLETGLKKNYQITNLQTLIKRGEKDDLKFDIEGIGNVKIDQKSNIDFSFKTKGIQEVQNVQNIVFFDSPVYIKIRKALEKSKEKTSLWSWLSIDKEDKYLKGYPEYLEELYSYMDQEYIDVADFDEISREIQDIIAGKLNMTKGGDINYTDSDGGITPLSLTAMGISNIGLIDLLLRNNVINEGSFLVMDEPEVHLHPEWQVVLAKILYKIAKKGANVIIATHSLDMLKTFQLLLKQDEEEAQEIISINKMPYSREFSQKTEIEKVSMVLDDLSRPFYELYMQDL